MSDSETTPKEEQQPAQETSPDSQSPVVITRRSGWADFMRLLGWASLLAAGAGVALALVSSAPGNQSMLGSLHPVILIIAGIVSAIQAFCFAFLIDVFTDIRWFVSKLVEKDEPDA